VVTPPPEVYTASGYSETEVALFATAIGCVLVHHLTRISNWEGEDNT
jgi:hypothetical protein